jgi:hypothetical protein
LVDGSNIFRCREYIGVVYFETFTNQKGVAEHRFFDFQKLNQKQPLFDFV